MTWEMRCHESTAYGVSESIYTSLGRDEESTPQSMQTLLGRDICALASGRGHKLGIDSRGGFRHVLATPLCTRDVPS